jgi:hypothetical protein
MRLQSVRESTPVIVCNTGVNAPGSPTLPPTRTALRSMTAPIDSHGYEAVANILTYGIGRGAKKLGYAGPPHEAPTALT